LRRYTPDELVQHPAFIHGLSDLARTLRAVFAEGPRLAKMLAAHQRWLLSQGGMALHLENGEEGLTIASLRGLITPHGIASRNTVQNFLEQLEIYRFIEVIGKNGRYYPRRYRATEASESAMFRWYASNLMVIDGLDGGMRVQQLISQPDLFRLSHPTAIRNCIESREWREPPESVALFLWTEGGGLVVDDFIARLKMADITQDRINVGYVNIPELASEFMMSRTHFQRMMRKAMDARLIGWTDETPRAGLWLSRKFLEDYAAWQAVKMAHVNNAFVEAVEKHGVEQAVTDKACRS
jgi:hypothetical protein